MASYLDTLKAEAPETLQAPTRQQFDTDANYQKASAKFNSTGNWATPAPGVINASSLNTPQASFKFPAQVDNTDFYANQLNQLGSMAQSNIEADQAFQEAQNKANEIQQDASSINALRNMVSGKEAYSQQQQELAGVGTAKKTLSDVNKRILGLNAQVQNIPALGEQAALGMGGLSYNRGRKDAAALREASIQGNILMAQQAAAQLDVDAAKELATNAVNLKYKDAEDALKSRLEAFDLNQKVYTTLSQKQRDAWDRAKYTAEQEQKKLDDQKETEKDINNIGLTLRKYGVSDNVVRDVLSSKNVNEAIIRAGNNLVDPKAKLELESLRAEIALKGAQARKAEREAQLSKEPTASEKKAQAQAVASAQNSRAAAQAKIDGVDAILNLGTGIASRVGPSALSRGIVGPTVGGAVAGAGAGPLGVAAGALAGGATGAISAFSGSGQQLAGAVHQLTSGLTLQTLIDAKANGATFGALTAPELNILASAATKLNDWEIKNEKGEPTGYWNIDEASFKKELKTIQDLSRKALLKTQGSLIAPEESSELDAMFPEAQIPANDYYN